MSNACIQPNNASENMSRWFLNAFAHRLARLRDIFVRSTRASSSVLLKAFVVSNRSNISVETRQANLELIKKRYRRIESTALCEERASIYMYICGSRNYQTVLGSTGEPTYRDKQNVVIYCGTALTTPNNSLSISFYCLKLTVMVLQTWQQLRLSFQFGLFYRQTQTKTMTGTHKS